MARKPEITERNPSPPHFRMEGATFVGPDTSNRGIVGANAGKAVKDVRRFSVTGLRACDGDKANS
jgi:hypothetical protein